VAVPNVRRVIDPIIAVGKKNIKLSKPLRDFGIVHMSQITVCIMAQAKISAARDLAANCRAAGLEFLLEPDQLRMFFGPSLMQLSFFNKVYGAESLWSETERVDRESEQRQL
jgi:hypothetical protein